MACAKPIAGNDSLPAPIIFKNIDDYLAQTKSNTNDWAPTNQRGNKQLFALCIKGVPSNMDEDKLRSVLTHHGKVTSVRAPQSDHCSYYFADCPTENDFTAIIKGMQNNVFNLRVEPKTSRKSNDNNNNDQKNKNIETTNINNVNSNHHDSLNQKNHRHNGRRRGKNSESGSESQILIEGKSQISQVSHTSKMILIEKPILLENLCEKKQESEYISKRTNNIRELFKIKYKRIVQNKHENNINNNNVNDGFSPLKWGLCRTCRDPSNKICERCDEFYCSVECQSRDWETHRFYCFKMPKLITINNDENKENISITQKHNNNKSFELMKQVKSNDSNNNEQTKLPTNESKQVDQFHQKNSVKNNRTGTIPKQNQAVNYNRNDNQQNQSVNYNRNDNQQYQSVNYNRNDNQQYQSVNYNRNDNQQNHSVNYNRNDNQQNKSVDYNRNDNQTKNTQMNNNQLSNNIKYNNQLENKNHDNIHNRNNNMKHSIQNIVKNIDRQSLSANIQSEDMIPKSGEKVSIVHFEDLDSVYIIPCKNSSNNKYSEIVKFIHTHSQNANNLKKLPNVNEYVVANYEDMWYRAIVLANDNPEQIHIYYIDFGNTDYKKFSELKELVPECHNLKQYVVRLYLKNLINEMKNDDITNYINKFVPETQFKIIYDSNDLNNKVVAELYNLETNENINNKLIELVKPIMFEDIKKEPLPAGENLSVIIVGNSMIDMGFFNCITSKDIKDLNDLNHRIMEYATSTNNPYSPKEDEMCIAKSINGSWHRAYCYEINDNSDPTLLFPDYGITLKVSTKNIRKFRKSFALPFKANACLITGLECLVGNCEAQDKNKIQQLEERLRELLPLNREIKLAKVEYLNDDTDAIAVHIPLVIHILREEGLLEN